MQPSTIPRYSNRDFPAYRFVPGLFPHPTRDPKGHSYGIEERPLESFGPKSWAACAQYVYGVDLFNHGYWWEAHEAWEAVWKAAGRRSETGLFIQGLIQISVAMLKSHQGLERAAGRLSADGLAKVSLVKGTYLGISVMEFSSQVRAYSTHTRESQPLIRLDVGASGDRSELSS